MYGDLAKGGAVCMMPSS